MIHETTLTRVSPGEVIGQRLTPTWVVVGLELRWELALGADMVGLEQTIDLGDVVVTVWEQGPRWGGGDTALLVAAVGAGSLLGIGIAAGVEGIGGAVGVGFWGISEGGRERYEEGDDEVDEQEIHRCDRSLKIGDDACCN